MSGVDQRQLRIKTVQIPGNQRIVSAAQDQVPDRRLGQQRFHRRAQLGIDRFGTKVAAVDQARQIGTALSVDLHLRPDGVDEAMVRPRPRREDGPDHADAIGVQRRHGSGARFDDAENLERIIVAVPVDQRRNRVAGHGRRLDAAPLQKREDLARQMQDFLARSVAVRHVGAVAVIEHIFSRQDFLYFLDDGKAPHAGIENAHGT